MRTVQLIPIMTILFFAAIPGCSRPISAADKESVENLKKELAIINSELAEARARDEELAGGLVKSLIAVRLEILKTNKALVEQRIGAIESGTAISVSVIGSKPDPQLAQTLQGEVDVQRTKHKEAIDYSAKYAGGLVKAMAESTVATSANTLALLEQKYLMAKYGMAFPSVTKSENDTKNVQQNKAVPSETANSKNNQQEKCLKIGDFDSSVLSRNDVFVELAWKADVMNSCDAPFQVRVRFVIRDSDDFELDDDSEDIYVRPQETGKGRGKMLVSPIEKANRMAKQGVSISAR